MRAFIQLSTLGLLLGFLLVGCTNNKAAEAAAAAEQELQSEIETLDSLSTELDDTAREIEENTKALEEALENLDGGEE